ncbi:Fis family transcriptional regulator [Sulfuricaulis limicola]|uniref:Fis family transcriptional regulator n=1 Tax=Sulfuricaulis limicola TaxID=1620215 RepID=A0A1B4XD78_9GAMM|nr:sigma 54-interacting transcriptional regulator [Sulfuricaulis limicola]BAV32777.1 Fis family transcriptional regulator [Sulfuricaulis limicola]
MSSDIFSTFQSLINTHDNPFVLIDENYRVVAANGAYQAAYGVEPSQIIGKHCYEVSHHRDSPCWQHGEDCPHREVFQNNRPCQSLHSHYDAIGRAEHVQIKGYIIPRPDGGKLLGESIFRLTSPEELDCDEMRMIGRAPAFLHAIEHLTRAADSNANVLLYGESGVGKELAAHYVHQHSPRKKGPFMAVDCASIAESLFESEIFGHERGSFTGCAGRQRGLFELADGGTLFLDEVGELSAAMQAKLLRVLETGEFRRVGGREVLRADVRVIAATNRHIRSMVERGDFREDLYYRMACINVDLPPLRERRSDIPVLAEALLSRLNQANRSHCYLTGEAMEKLTNYDFPGNVRELRNILHRASAMCGANNGAITAVGLVFDHDASPVPGGNGGWKIPSPAPLPAGKQPLSMREVESRYMADLLTRFEGQRRPVAAAMGISERTLYRKLKRYGLGGASDR